MNVAAVPNSNVPTAELRTWKKPVFCKVAMCCSLTAGLEHAGSATAAILCGGDMTAPVLPSQHYTFAIVQHTAMSYMPQQLAVYDEILQRPNKNCGVA